MPLIKDLIVMFVVMLMIFVVEDNGSTSNDDKVRANITYENKFQHNSINIERARSDDCYINEKR